MNEHGIIHSVLEDMKYGPRRLSEDNCLLGKSYQGRHYKLVVQPELNQAKLIYQRNCWSHSGESIELYQNEIEMFVEAVSSISKKTQRMCAGCGILADASEGHHVACGKCIYCGRSH